MAKVFGLLIKALVVVISIIILSLTIAILVKVYQKNDDDASTTVAPATTLNPKCPNPQRSNLSMASLPGSYDTVRFGLN